MKKLIIVLLILAGIGAVVYGLSGDPHEFLPGDCAICHVDEKNDPLLLRTPVTQACEKCHENIREIQSHPTDIYPSMEIPEDMLLVDGMLTCITCHYSHPRKKKQFVKKQYFLRRFVRGPLFCNICHELNDKGHVIFANLHSGKFTETDRSMSLDRMSVECIECHDRYINEPTDFIGVGTWEHTGGKTSHPIGVRYGQSKMSERRFYRPKSMLPKGVRLFDGKVGCGTCHNIYSKIKNMLVMDNTGSRLCLECHIK